MGDVDVGSRSIRRNDKVVPFPFKLKFRMKLSEIPSLFEIFVPKRNDRVGCDRDANECPDCIS